MTRPRMAAVTVLSLVVYLGLEIAGAGGAARFFSYPALIAVTLITIALGFAALFSEGHLGSGVREDRSNRWVIAALGALGRRWHLFARLYGPDRFPNLRRRWGALARCSSLCGRRRSSPRAGLRAWALQRPGCDPARTPTDHRRALRNHPPSELSRPLRPHAGWGIGVPLRGGRPSLPCCRSVSCSLAFRLWSAC
jgi:hypothetical protein